MSREIDECEFADELFIFSASPEMLEEMLTEEERQRFDEHFWQDPPCPYCQKHSRALMEFFARIAASGVTAEELMRGLKRPSSGADDEVIPLSKQQQKTKQEARLQLAAGAKKGDRPSSSIRGLDDGKVMIDGQPYVFAQDERRRILLSGLVPTEVAGVSFSQDEPPYALRRCEGLDEPAYEVIGLTLGILRGLLSNYKGETPVLYFRRSES